ncbi:MAG: class I SAM-dependent methyltransferase [Chloroflexota bacterium]
MTDNPNTSPRISAELPRHHIPCNLCGSENRTPFMPQNGKGLVQCNNCGLVYVSPRPDATELYALYGETYFRNDDDGTVGYHDYIADERNIRRTFNRRLDILHRFIQPGSGRKLLDVGCAAGFFIDEADRRGWQVEGLDVSGFAVEYVQEQYGHEAYNTSLLDADNLEDESYSLLTMWDVIEHVPDPKANIERASELLHSGGVFALITPDVGSLVAKLTGKRWIGYKLSEEHVYYFSIRTLSRMLNEAGFDVVDIRHEGKFVTLRLFLDRLGFYAPFLSQPLQAVERALNLSERSAYINPFDMMWIVARKR